MERTELKEIMIACCRTRRLAAQRLFNSKGTPKDKKLVESMLSCARQAQQIAECRAGTFMFNNVTKELGIELDKQELDDRNLLVAMIKTLEADNAVN